MDERENTFKNRRVKEMNSFSFVYVYLGTHCKKYMFVVIFDI